MSVLTELQDIKATIKMQLIATKKVLTMKEVSEYFGIEQGTLYNLTSKKLIPHSKKKGVGIRFDKEEVEKWIISNPITTDDDLEKAAASYILKNKR